MDQVAQIREKIDIVSFISQFIPVKKAGRNFRAICPFHTEKSPSFMISPDRQIWHCFGCSKGGDVYAFLMEYERLEFPEALRMLAKQTGIELQNTRQDSGFTSKKEQIYQINALAKEYYHYVLTKLPAGKPALDYLKNRGISEKMIETFYLGFSPSSGTALVKYLVGKKQFPIEDVIEAGLTYQRNGQSFDFFRGRLMFPLIDQRDNVVGFSGRIMEKNDNISKYVNTRETLVYHKGDHFFGINITKDAIRRENQAIIMEGEFDVISSFQHGVSNVLGVKGTALTESQVNLIGRYAQKVTFCFDGDKAGQEAIKRSLSVVEKKGLTPTVIEVPGGKDPDESLQKDPAEFKKAVRDDRGIYDYLIEKTFQDMDIESVESKQHAADTLLPIIAAIKNEIIKEHYIKKLSSELETSYETIVKEMARLERREREVIKDTKPAQKVRRPKEEAMEEFLLAMIIQSHHTKKMVEKTVAILSDTLTRDRAYQKILYQLLRHFEQTDVFDGKKFGDSLPKELISVYDTCLLYPLPAFENDTHEMNELEKHANKLREVYIRQRMKLISEEIRLRETDGQDEQVEALKKEYSELAGKLDIS